MTKCNFKVCDCDTFSRGWCGTHYQQFRKGKTMTPIADQTKGTCKIEGCDLPHHGKGMCYAHYMRDYKGSSYTGPVKQMRVPGKRPCGKTRCPAARRLKAHMYYLNDKDVYLDRAKGQTETAQYKKVWKQKNPAKVRAANMARKRGLKKATPPWLTREQWAEMNEIYISCPLNHHVDHIVPLRGKNICGLHVPWNLQHLPADENMAKSNNFC
jgi:hypothetical protein